jgi:hypothetical protein
LGTTVKPFGLYTEYGSKPMVIYKQKSEKTWF